MFSQFFLNFNVPNCSIFGEYNTKKKQYCLHTKCLQKTFFAPLICEQKGTFQRVGSSLS